MRLEQNPFPERSLDASDRQLRATLNMSSETKVDSVPLKEADAASAMLLVAKL